jgi:preprotein translocase subunit SecA
MRQREVLRTAPSAALAAATPGGGGEAPTEAEIIARVGASCEAARRALGLEPYDTQVRAALVMQRGGLAEMGTGEGKTLAIAIAGAVEAMAGRRVHVVTANDYLARRDAEAMAPLLALLGLRSGCRQQGQDHAARRAAHGCDVVYGTAAELSFDLLMDSFRAGQDDAVCGAFDVAIVDEADHILIDEAANPLAITADVAPDERACRAAAALIAALEPDHIEGGSESQVALSESGLEAAERWLAAHDLAADGGLFAPANLTTANRIWQALHAKHRMVRDVHYLVRDGAVLVLDPRTGRATRGRFGEGLHQAIEAKEGLALSPEQGPLAAITMRAFALRYAKRAATTATAAGDADELDEVYGLTVDVIPPRVPSRRVDHDDRFYMSAAARDDAVLALVRERHAKGQPILVGTTGIPATQALSARLAANRIAHNVLHAHFDANEAAIVAQAGRLGAVTVATNMAGRGTDIVLGGAASGAEHDAAVAAGGLLAIGIERQKLRRLDQQLRGRAGRQGDPGESVFMFSLEDPLFAETPPDAQRRLAAMSPQGPDDRLSGEMPARLAAAIQDKAAADARVQRAAERAYGEILGRQRDAWAELRIQLLLPHDPDEAAVGRVLAAAARFADHPEALAFEPAQAVMHCSRLVAEIDAGWRVHVAALDVVRGAIDLRRFGDRDPLTEYRVEALASFERMLAKIRDRFREILGIEASPPDA